MVAAFALRAAAQTESRLIASAPDVAFRSTSTMTGSGSSLSAMPVLNADGMASYEGAEASAPANAPSGPRRIGPVTPEGDPTPLGNAALPLVVMAVLYVLFRRPVARRF